LATLQQKKYTESDKVKEAYQNYLDYKDSNLPNDYVFSQDELLKATQDELFNKEDFSYDVESDPLYGQYKSMYTDAGRSAMEDSVGNASALTGGYGNSYAQTAGISAYNAYLGKLNNVIPQLYDAAYSRYNDELDRLEHKLGYLSDQNKEEYSRYLDGYNAYTNEVNALRELYLREYDNDIAIQDSEWESAYKIAMAEQQREIANAELGYKYYAANQSQAQFEAQLAYQKELDAANELYRQEQLAVERRKVVNQNSQFWAEFNSDHAEKYTTNELYALRGNEYWFDLIAALDYNYSDDEMVRLKALTLGVEPEYLDAYFANKYAE